MKYIPKPLDWVQSVYEDFDTLLSDGAIDEATDLAEEVRLQFGEQFDLYEEMMDQLEIEREEHKQADIINQRIDEAKENRVYGN